MNALRSPNVGELIAGLEDALTIEHTVIPPYLTALYSLPKGEAADVFHSVVIEEMEHLLKVANILIAVGASPALTRTDRCPRYPARLPRGIGAAKGEDFRIPLRHFSPQLVHDVFCRIEAPGPASSDDALDSIGGFYRWLQEGLRDLGPDIFVGDPARQARCPSRNVPPVLSLDDALDTIDSIVLESEGPAGRQSHYELFMDLLRKPLASSTVLPLMPDPTSTSYPEGSIVRRRSDQFNRSYTSLLLSIDHALNGHPNTIDAAIGLMYQLKLDAMRLVETPVPGTPWLASPTFELVA